MVPALYQVVHHCPYAQDCLSSMPEWLLTGGPHLSGQDDAVFQVINSSFSQLDTWKGGYENVVH